MYEFTEDCMIHIPQIDEEHRKLFQIINDALSLVKTTEDISGIAQSLLLHLKDYANTHFAHEEAYMEQIHDPELPLQKKEHAEFADKPTPTAQANGSSHGSCIRQCPCTGTIGKVIKEYFWK